MLSLVWIHVATVHLYIMDFVWLVFLDISIHVLFKATWDPYILWYIFAQLMKFKFDKFVSCILTVITPSNKTKRVEILFWLHREESDPNVKLCISMKDNETVITSDAGMEYEFVYDYSIWSCNPKDPHYVGQKKLYEMMGRPLLNSAFEGYNTCLFAYGQVILL